MALIFCLKFLKARNLDTVKLPRVSKGHRIIIKVSALSMHFVEAQNIFSVSFGILQEASCTLTSWEIGVLHTLYDTHGLLYLRARNDT